MDDFEIEILPGEKQTGEAVQLPLNFLTIGEIKNDDVKVYIKQDVYKALEEYACSDTNHELGTVILGNYAEELGKMHIVISDYIIAKYTDASASTLTFTHKTWDYIHKEHEVSHKGTKIVGWQHTHPGYGIFLSNYDLFIQENFFNVPFQVAYVIDPVQHLRGFFQWKNGRIEELKGFYIYDDVGKKIKINNPKPLNNIRKNDEIHTIKRSYKLIQGILIIVVVLLVAATIFLSGKYAKQIDKQKELEKEIASQSQTISAQASEIDSIKSEMRKNLEIGINASKAETESKEMESRDKSEKNDKDNEIVKQDPVQESKTEEQNAMKERETAKQDSVNEAGNDTNKVNFQAYTVKNGDSLIAICKDAGLDYHAAYRIILSVNGIKDPNEIYVGQTLLLPLF